MLLKKMEQPPKMIVVGLGYLIVGLDQHHAVVEVLEASLDCELHTAELPGIPSSDSS